MPPSQLSPGAVKGAVEERAPAGLGGEPLARGPADFLLISSRKPAPCAGLRTALGRGDSEVLSAPAQEGELGRGTLAAVAGGDAGLPGPVPALCWALEL